MHHAFCDLVTPARESLEQRARRLDRHLHFLVEARYLQRCSDPRATRDAREPYAPSQSTARTTIVFATETGSNRRTSDERPTKRDSKQSLLSSESRFGGERSASMVRACALFTLYRCDTPRLTS